jgi:thiol-disulfide isomerase/thioredoxin
MRPNLLLILSVLTLTFTACQSKTYRISGTVKGADGDTLYITTDMATGKPMSKTVVSEGHFTLEGETDSALMAVIYSKTRENINTPFFLEPGADISITLSETPGEHRIGGSNLNNKLQVLNDSMMTYGKEINRIAEHVYGSAVNEKEKQDGMAKIEQLTSNFKKCAAVFMRENIDNEFGFFLLTNYQDIVSNEELGQLVKQMPDRLRQRKEIKSIEQSLALMAKTAAGATLPDFTQSTPDGGELSAMSIIKQNRITVIDFWASWCGPCREEMPFMLQFYENYKDKGLGILGVSLDKNRGAWTAAIKQLKMPWPQMSDLKGWENAAAKEFNITSIPHTIIVDQQGRILQRGLRRTQLEQFVASQLK